MMRVATILLCSLFAVFVFAYDEEAKEEFFPSTPEQVATLNERLVELIGGVISPLSGQPALRKTDLVARGAQNVFLSRTYIAPQMPRHFPKRKQNQKEWDKYCLYQWIANGYKGWQFYPHVKLQFSPYRKEILLTDCNGMTLCFRLQGSEAKFASSSFGLSNASLEIPSGKYDPRNTRVFYEPQNHKIKVQTPNGGVRFYLRRGRLSDLDLLYLLEKEILPNGKVLRYHYNKLRELTCIESKDPKERFVYAFLRIEGSPWTSHCHFVSSSGQSADYRYERRALRVKIKEKIKHWYGDHKTKKKWHFLCPPILSSVSSPRFRHESLDYCGKFLLNAYSGKEEIFTVLNRGFGKEMPHFRAYKLFLPVGENEAFKPVYELFYKPPIAGKKGGITTVKNSDGTSTAIYFSKDLLCTAIQHFGREGHLKKEKMFSWDENHFLKTIAVQDGQKRLLYKKSFEYDQFGNPILEVFSGNLTGEKGGETHTIKRVFSEEGRNLLLREETEEGKIFCFSYLPNTNLLTSKLTKDKGKIVLRDFFIYDDCHNLIQTLSDDGSRESKEDLFGVTQRHITTYLLRQVEPFLHMPEWIVKTYLELGVQRLLKKRHLIYDSHGNVMREEVYDAKGQHAYILCTTYNERGDILSKTNRLGQKALYTYDGKGHLKTEKNFSGRIHKTLSYDAKGRLCKVIEEGDEGNCHVTSSNYDFHDRLIQKKDFFGNSTHYKYDPLVNKISQVDSPSIASVNEEKIPVRTHVSYDPLGRKCVETDANGHMTTTRYNAYGSPIEILHPNGGREFFRYTRGGKLISHTDLDGLVFHYKRDILGRILKKTTLSKENEILAQETFTYSGFNLLTKTDKEGHLKQYFYDGAGRKIREEFCGRTTKFAYDPLGRCAGIYKYNKKETLVIHYKRDLEDRIIEEKKTSLSGNLLYKINYAYDADGNLKAITRHINGKETTESFAYDAFQRKIFQKDALGYETQISYDENHINALGQRGLQIKTVDPKGIVTLETYDALLRNVQMKRLGSNGQTISCHDMTYDPQGNLTFHQDPIYKEGKLQTIQKTKYVYTSHRQVKNLTRGYGTCKVRETRCTYLPSGKIKKKTLPDDTSLSYCYNPLGYLSRIDSSDGTICHAFTYNRLGHLLTATDERQNLKIKREVDPFGNMLFEEFPCGMQIAKTYDDFNRPLSLVIAGHGEVHYTYDPLFLREVTRVSSQGTPLYKHLFETYDLDGNLTREHLIGGLGTILHARDARGQKMCLVTPYFSEKCQYDSIYNLIFTDVDGKPSSYQYDKTSQMIREESFGNEITHSYDSLYNRIQKNGSCYEVNALNEIVSDGEATYEYDLRGNRVLTEPWHMIYDPLNQLIEAKSKLQKIAFIYDPLGRRLAKIISAKTQYGWEETDREYYLFDGKREIGAFIALNRFKNFRVLSPHQLPKTLGIEIGDKIFAPLTDVHGNIRRLIDLESKALAISYDFTAFGEKLRAHEALKNPWQFASKRFDSHLDLIHFGKRDYDPKTSRWLTMDPAGFIDSYNPYQYVLNNPFRYYDLSGENLLGFLCGVGQIIAGGAIMASGIGLEVATCGGYTFALGIHESVGLSLMMAGVATTTYHAQDLSSSRRTKFPSPAISQENYITTSFQEKYGENLSTTYKKKKGSVDEKLSDDPLNDPNLEDVSHPQAKEQGRHKFRDRQTGEIIEYDEAQSGKTGHKGHDHYHRPNPNSTGKKNYYLDSNGNPVPKGSESSHLYPPEWIWWE